MNRRLVAMLDTLLPGGDGFPSASAAGVPEWLSDEPRFAPVLSELLELLPEGFEDQGPDVRAELLAEVEAAAPGQFNDAVVAAYSGYYTRAAVLDAVGTACGYRAGPPQPGGHHLPPFDEAILEVPKSRRQSWLDPEKGTGK